MNSSFTRPHTLLSALVTAATFLTGSFWNSQAQSPAAIQAPNYRQPGSAYSPPPLNPAPTGTPGYQSGFGSPPSKGTAPKPITKAPTKSAPKTTPKPAAAPSTSLESRLSRLEKNDARQDQRLISLEAGAARPSGGMSSLPATASGKTYVVRPGDNLSEIATRHGTTTAALRSVNGLPNDELYIGQTLDLPSATPAASSPESSLGGFHIVRAGEVFSVIAAHYGITQDALARANPTVYPDTLLIGERLRIPAGARRTPATGGSSSQQAASPVSSTRSHIVGRGESLGAIAKKYGIPTATLASANKIRNPNLILPGQRLTVPGSARSQSTSQTTRTALASADSDLTALPDALLPKPASTTTAAANTDKPAATTTAPDYPADKPRPISNSNPARGVVAYRLERGDSLATVANMFSTSEENIRQMNKLPADKKIKEGDEIVVPALGAVSLN